MDPQVGPVTLKISGSSAVLLTRLADKLGTDDAGAVLMRALGLLEMAVSARDKGHRLAVFDPATMDATEIAF